MAMRLPLDVKWQIMNSQSCETHNLSILGVCKNFHFVNSSEIFYKFDIWMQPSWVVTKYTTGE